MWQVINIQILYKYCFRFSYIQYIRFLMFFWTVTEVSNLPSDSELWVSSPVGADLSVELSLRWPLKIKKLHTIRSCYWLSVQPGYVLIMVTLHLLTLLFCYCTLLTLYTVTILYSVTLYTVTTVCTVLTHHIVSYYTAIMYIANSLHC